MVIEHFRGGDAAPVYRRFRERGRLAPDGLTYVASWVDAALRRCYQVMETHDPALLEEWMGHWRDLVDFEVHPVISSAEASERVARAERNRRGRSRVVRSARRDGGRHPREPRSMRLPMRVSRRLRAILACVGFALLAEWPAAVLAQPLTPSQPPMPSSQPPMGSAEENTPSTQSSDQDLPDTELPDATLPDTDLPDQHLPDTDLPDQDLPSGPIR
jgi:hypothetical protein